MFFGYRWWGVGESALMAIWMKRMADPASQASSTIVRRLIHLLRPYWRWVLLGVLSALISAGMQIVTPYLSQRLTDTALAFDKRLFFTLVGIALGAMALDALVAFGNKYLVTYYSTCAVRDLRNRTTEQIQRTPMWRTDARHSGDLISRLSSDADQITTFLSHFPNLFYEPIVFSLGIMYIFIVDWRLLLVICALIPISAVLYNRFSKPLQHDARSLAEQKGKATAKVQDTISGMAIVKAFNLQATMVERFKPVVHEIEVHGLKIGRRRALLVILFLTLRFVPQLTCVLYGGYLAYLGEITVGELLAVDLLIWSVFQPVEAFLQLLAEFRETRPAVERVYEILDQPAERSESGAFTISPQADPVIFEHVSFGYDGGQKILDGLDCAVKTGETVALVGPSGCGKSTLLRLLCGFYEPQSGSIRIYGNDLFHSDLSVARQYVSLVSQDTYLFPTTIAENIAYGRLGALQGEIIAAAKAANAHDFITAFEKHYDTPVGEWGAKLSGGERQRIALARAILKDAPILLLDEPTSALDTQSEAVVQEALDRLMQGRTVLIIAHRLSTIQDADRIFVLNEGKIQESGTHAGLMRAGGLYRQLYLKQMTSSVEREV